MNGRALYREALRTACQRHRDWTPARVRLLATMICGHDENGAIVMQDRLTEIGRLLGWHGAEA